jgi:hypothetical protein
MAKATLKIRTKRTMQSYLMSNLPRLVKMFFACLLITRFYFTYYLKKEK